MFKDVSYKKFDHCMLSTSIFLATTGKMNQFLPDIRLLLTFSLIFHQMTVSSVVSCRCIEGRHLRGG